MLSFLKRLEDKDQSLLGPNLLILHTWGIWKRSSAYNYFMFYFFIFGFVYFVPSQYIELWYLRNDTDLALRNLSTSLLSTVCFVKAGTFVFWNTHWKKVVENVADVERYLVMKNDKKIDDLIKKYTKYSRAITYFYWCLAFGTSFVVTLAPLLAGFLIPENRQRILNGSDPYPEIMSSWVPFDKSRGLGYLATCFLQASVYAWGGGLVSAFDSTAFTVTIFFAGQLKILKLNCERLFQNTELGHKEALERIKECHLHHVNLVEHCKILNSLLSPVLFLYIIICSVMICATATRLQNEGTAIYHQIYLAEYLFALISQLFLYCWHSDTVYYNSLDVDFGVLSSEWWNSDIRTQRSVIILAGQLRKHIIFTAGPFTTLGLSTFVNILKGSYSYYTLLK